MQRRDFLQLGLAASLATVAGSAPRSGPLAGKINKAVKYLMVTEKLSVADKLRLLKDLGFDGVEVRTADRVDQRELTKAIEVTERKRSPVGRDI